MKTFTLLLPLVAAAMCTAERVIDKLYPTTVGGDCNQNSYDVVWNQTQQTPLNQTVGGLGSSVSGYFPKMSKKKIGLGCGLNWKDGQLHAGFDGGDPDNGIGGGFDWTPNALSGIVGVHFQNTKINLNVTITEENQVLFNVNGKDLDWERVLQQESPKEPKEAGEGYNGEGYNGEGYNGEGYNGEGYNGEGHNGEVQVGYYDRKPDAGAVKPEILP
ncbi:uncharacterized protein SPSC_02941 [Sporisorium scitamineum]|uniref:Uncharacterized protein n=1 Tax=Sporisorium scitamineum TaxID=49012 RepID=A0A127Z6F5_9BASI|nr:uncharacterized protein SPSC_02941 [Sporisorium scitamineum]